MAFSLLWLPAAASQGQFLFLFPSSSVYLPCSCLAEGLADSLPRFWSKDSGITETMNGSVDYFGEFLLQNPWAS